MYNDILNQFKNVKDFGHKHDIFSECKKNTQSAKQRATTISENHRKITTGKSADLLWITLM